MEKRHLTIAVAGCGSRGSTYARIMAGDPKRFRIVAGADPNPDRLAQMKAISGEESFQAFTSHEEMLAGTAPLADVLVIATQDQDHVTPCLRAMDQGYDVLLEKPAATRPEEVMQIAERARSKGRRLLLGFVLRYTNFYRKVKEIVDSGRLGDVLSIQACEGVEAWHQGHSFVRGHWRRAADSTPMLVAKSSHDMDIIAWLLGRPCRRISSFGARSFFKRDRMPEGATARCGDGCPHQGACLWDAQRYLGDKKNWLQMVFARAGVANDGEILDWLGASDWGRCVFQCDNDVVDHQVVSMEFEGGATAGFTMTAFDEGRSIQIYGTRGMLDGKLGSPGPEGTTLWCRDHGSGETESFNVEAGGQGHQGGDEGLIEAAASVFTGGEEVDIDSYIEGHLMGFAGEEARMTGQVIDMGDYRKRLLN